MNMTKMTMNGAIRAAAVAGALLGMTATAAFAQDASPAPAQSADKSTATSQPVPEGGYEVHDKRRPQPPVVTPGTFSSQDQPGTPPSDAIVLFDGKDLSKWRKGTELRSTAGKVEHADAGGDQPAPWKVDDGALVVQPHTGIIETKDEFADVQLHVEWMEPRGIAGRSQGRGNSGIFLMGLYEIQVLDNYQNETYADGTAGSIYGQYPPLANATRPQGQWQVYDVVFHPPKVENRKVTRPASETVFLNGVLVQDNSQLMGPTQHQQLTSYPSGLPPKGPLQLQDHGNPVRFRNIWLRPIPTIDEHPVPSAKSAGENYYEKGQTH